MRSVLIAEDEVLVRMGLQVSVPWDKHGLTVVGEASSGTQALELYKQLQPDILITDLIMPGLNGLELIRQIRDQGHPCAVIVITCMDRFDLLKEAMDLDVVDYLVKATMYVTDIEKALVKANHYLGASSDAAPAGRELRKEREQLLVDYVLGHTMTAAVFAQRGAACGMQEGPLYMLGVRYTSQLEISWQLQRILRNMLTERLEKLHAAHVLQEDSFLCILFDRQPDKDLLTQTMDDLRSYMDENFSLEMTIAACASPLQFSELPSLASAMRQLPQSPSLFWVDAQGAPVREDLSGRFLALRKLLWQTGDFAFARRAVNRAYLLEETLPHSEASFREQAVQFMESLAHAAQSAPPPLAADLTPPRLVDALYAFAQERLPRCRAEIGRVIEVIVEHPETDLSLNDGAALAAIHPQYLSNLFKKEVGAGYSEFINVVRVTAAQQLLKDDRLTIQQVAEQCGFSDTPYFTRRFKAVAGMTPGEWRRVAR